MIVNWPQRCNTMNVGCRGRVQAAGCDVRWSLQTDDPPPPCPTVSKSLFIHIAIIVRDPIHAKIGHHLTILCALTDFERAQVLS
jgi:hypothetical protein